MRTLGQDCEAKIARLHDRIDELVRELREVQEELKGRARARPARVPATVASIGIEPWMQSSHDSTRR